MIDDATVFRLGDDNFRFVGGDPYDGVWLKEQAERLGLKAFVKPSTDQLHNLAVQGPASRAIMLRELVWTPPTQPALDELKWFRFCVGRIGDYDGHPGRRLAHRLHRRARLRGLVPPRPTAPPCGTRSGRPGSRTASSRSGLEALDMVRIEAGLIFAGYEFDDQVDPFEAGIGFTVALDDDEDFVGRAALEERRAHPAAPARRARARGQRDRRARRLRLRRPPARRRRHQRPPQPARCARPIALCRMAVQYAETGTEVEVGKLDGQQKRIPAEVVRFPFYDPDKTRPRA